jgi:superoxide dismutase, Cu-Zn family
MRTSAIQDMTTDSDRTDNSRPRGPRRLAAAALAVGTVLALSACGAEGDGAGTPPGTNIPNPEITDEASDPDAQTNPAPTEQKDAGGTQPAGTFPVTVPLADVDGNEVGDVTIDDAGAGVQLEISVENLDPGFYGMHLHEIGKCEPDSAAPDDPADTGAFKSAGSHIPGEDGAEHPDHAGDLPTLLVNEDGTATMTVVTHRLDRAVLLDDDGSAVMIHADPDNFANVPGGGGEDTTSTGDAGDRLACGVIGDQ